MTPWFPPVQAGRAEGGATMDVELHLAGAISPAAPPLCRSISTFVLSLLVPAPPIDGGRAAREASDLELWP
jgi:hypothetical protein